MSSKSKFQALKDGWPSPFVLRTQVRDFSNGLLNPGTLRNADYWGVGPEGRFKFGRKVAYSVEALIKYLDSKVEG